MVVFTTLILAQNPPLDYFPHGIGDRWEYRDAVDWRIEDILTIENDSLAPNGNIFLKYFEKPDYTIRIDTNNFVGQWNYLFNEVDYFWYKLDGQIGERWVVREDTIFNENIWAEVKDIYQGQVFNQTTSIIKFEYWLEFAPNDSFWIGNRWLAKGFGHFDSFIEPGSRIVLAGAIIDGTRYGQITNINPKDEIVSGDFILNQNYPNPFNPSTKINFSIHKPGIYFLKVFDINGKEISTLLSSFLASGDKTVIWYGNNKLGNPVKSGVYFYQLKTKDFSQTRRMILLK